MSSDCEKFWSKRFDYCQEPKYDILRSVYAMVWVLWMLNPDFAEKLKLLAVR